MSLVTLKLFPTDRFVAGYAMEKTQYVQNTGKWQGARRRYQRSYQLALVPIPRINLDHRPDEGNNNVCLHVWDSPIVFRPPQRFHMICCSQFVNSCKVTYQSGWGLCLPVVYMFQDALQL